MNETSECVERLSRGFAMTTPFRMFLLLFVPCLALTACHLNDPEPFEAQLSDGVYGVSYILGDSAADEQRILAITASLNRSAGQLVFTLSDGSQKTLSFSPRPKSQWARNCYGNSMHSFVLGEIADVAPAPLVLEALTFSTPLVYAECAPVRMILSDSYDGSVSLVMDLK